GRVGRPRGRLAPTPAQAGEVPVTDPRGGEALLQGPGPELRMATGTGEPADVGDHRDRRSVEQVEKAVEPLVRVSDGPDGPHPAPAPLLDLPSISAEAPADRPSTARSWLGAPIRSIQSGLGPSNRLTSVTSLPFSL